jgi:hypothetical protein
MKMKKFSAQQTGHKEENQITQACREFGLPTDISIIDENSLTGVQVVVGGDLSRHSVNKGDSWRYLVTDATVTNATEPQRVEYVDTYIVGQPCTEWKQGLSGGTYAVIVTRYYRLQWRVSVIATKDCDAEVLRVAIAKCIESASLPLPVPFVTRGFPMPWAKTISSILPSGDS